MYVAVGFSRVGLAMDPAFLFAGVRLDRKKFASDFSRFQVRLQLSFSRGESRVQWRTGVCFLILLDREILERAGPHELVRSILGMQAGGVCGNS